MKTNDSDHCASSRLVRAGSLLAAASIAAFAGAAAASPTLEVLDSMAIPVEGANGTRIEEFSGLSWDEDERLLYAVSDGGGLHHFQVRLDGDSIAGIVPVFSTPLAMAAEGGSGKPISNAEGITTMNDDNGEPSDSEILIAFEDGPAVGRFTPQGEWIANLALPGPLGDKERYSKKNSRIEAVAFDREHGMLTAPERPLEGEPDEFHTIYAADGTTWSFEAFQPDSRLKAIQNLPDGNLLILERTRVDKGAESTARLRYLDFGGCSAQGACRLIDLSAAPDPMLVDNFEGLARLSEDLFLIVTDKTTKDAEPTTFVLFRVTAAAR